MNENYVEPQEFRKWSTITEEPDAKKKVFSKTEKFRYIDFDNVYIPTKNKLTH